MKKTAALCLMLILAAACGEAPSGRAGGGPTPSPEPEASRTGPDASPQKYRATATVLQDEKDDRPEFCLGGVATSLPPQCGGPPLEGWDWAAVPDEETRSGVTWGDYEVTGTYDGETFTVLDVGPPRWSSSENDPIENACEEPPGGWERPNPNMDSRSDLERAIGKARREADFAGAWVGYIGEPSDLAPDDEIILDLAFTGDLDMHEREVREDWGGPLCLAQRERTLDELLEIQRELHEIGPELDLEILGSSASETRNVVELEVILFHPDTQRKVDERYGAGIVELRARLQPVP